MKRWPCFRWLTLAGAVLSVSGAWTLLKGQDDDDLRRAVARISLMEGDVSVRRGDSGEWVAGVINAPLLADDRISTAPNSRAEVQLDASNVLRIGGNAEVHLTQLEYGRYQMEVAHGTVTYAVVRASNANAEVDTPSVSVRPSRIGVYRIAVNDAGETQVTARAGEVEVFTPRGSQWVSTGQMMLARGSASDPEYQIVAALGIDDWDRWNESRDRMLARSTSYQYVPQGVYGAEDLDSAGTWANVEPYGYCWRPTVGIDVGWAPYSRGRWVWEDWYGWTWVSYDPWGWAPYHYGRWFSHGGNWWWYPGVLGRRHYWSPALVAFFGFGHGGVGFGFGNVGWVPLAPYETFHPWWGRGYYGSAGYRNRGINITNVNITNVYRNARVGRGISAVSAGDFQAGRFHSVGRYSGDQVREAGLIRGQMPFAPGSNNLRFADRSPGHTPQARANQTFFRHQQPNPVQRVPFAQQQRSFEQAARGGFAGGTETPNRGNAVTGRMGSPARIAQDGGLRNQGSPANVSPRGADNPGANGWRRFGGAATPDRAPQGNRSMSPRNDSAPSRGQSRPEATGSPAPSNRGGWQRFGEPGTPARRDFNSGARSSDQPSGGSNGSRYAAPRGNQETFRVSPPVVRERQQQAQPRSYESPRSYQAPQRSYESPRTYQAPQRSYESPRTYQAPQRSYESPRSYQAAPRSYESPRSYQAPQRSYESPRSYQAPQRSYQSPRSAPAPSYSAPRGGGGFSAPRSSGGGGGFSAPRGNSGGGGGHYSGGSRSSGGPRGGGRR